jgi:DNA processing protein
LADDLDRLRLARSEGVGPITYRRLLERFSDVTAAIDALPALARAGGRAASPRIPPRDEVAREAEALARLGGRFLYLGGAEYPPLLAELADAPPVIAVLGPASLLTKSAIGMVGARNASANGLHLTETLATALAAQHVIVSGLARGIDSAAHAGAMVTGQTVAVIAGGLDRPYPPENAALQAAIAQNGVVVAEAPLGTAPIARHFPKRNRIIAGLVRGLVVIEAAARSGSLLTARLANEAGREIFAVPGSPLDPRAAGANGLIKQGAHLIESAADVFDNLPTGLFAATRRYGYSEEGALWEEAATTTSDLDRARRLVPSLIGADPVAVDEIARRCQLTHGTVSAVLLELELGGQVYSLTGNRVARVADDFD